MTATQDVLKFFYKRWAQSGIALGLLQKKIDEIAPRFNGAIAQAVIKNNLVMNCNLNDHVQSRIYFLGAYEPIESYLLHQLIGDDSTILDVGANVGFYSLYLSTKIKSGHIYAFEPVAKNRDLLEKNIQTNQLQNKVTVIDKGLWHENTTLTFSLDQSMERNQGSFTAGKVKSSHEQVKCEVIRLDDFVQSQPVDKVDFIKMDIEGAELSALKGGENTLSTHRPGLLIEINKKAAAGFNYKPQDIADFLKSLDYCFYHVNYIAAASGFVDHFKDIEQGNILALQKHHIERLAQDWDAKQIKKYFLKR